MLFFILYWRETLCVGTNTRIHRTNIGKTTFYSSSALPPLQIIFPPSHTLALRYFNGDTGEGIGASHQTGWTALVASLIGEPKDETVTGAGTSPAPSLHTDVVY